MSDPYLYIHPTNSLLKEKLKGEVIDKICNKIKSFPNYERYKTDLELLLMTCLCVEHLIFNKKDDKYKINKRDLILEAYHLCFKDLNNADRENILKNIEFLHDNGKIEKVKNSRIIFYTLKDWFNRKIA